MAYPDLPKQKPYSWLNIVLILICIAMFGYSIFYFNNPDAHSKLMEQLDLSGNLEKLNDKIININDNEDNNGNTDTGTLIGDAAQNDVNITEALEPSSSLDNATDKEVLLVAPLSSSEKAIGIDGKNLPLLNKSDPLFLTMLGEMSDEQFLIANSLLSNGLLRSSVVFIDNFSRGDFIASFSPLIPPKAAFSIDASDGQPFMSADSYQRYNNYADYFVSLDNEKIVQALHTLKPLINRAFAEIARPNAKFDSTLNQAIEMALSAPIIYGPIALKSPSVMYLFDDPELEALNDAQKLMLRLGPENLDKVQQKLRSLQSLLNQQQKVDQEQEKTKVKNSNNATEESWNIDNTGNPNS